jgi:hypothetical protein
MERVLEVCGLGVAVWPLLRLSVNCVDYQNPFNVSWPHEG